MVHGQLTGHWDSAPFQVLLSLGNLALNHEHMSSGDHILDPRQQDMGLRYICRLAGGIHCWEERELGNP